VDTLPHRATRPTVTAAGAVTVQAPPSKTATCAMCPTATPILGPADVADRRPDLVLALDDLTEPPPGWAGVPIYAVHDLVDVVHRLTDVPHVHFVR
jgi:galactose-1-phosphate uridylyltransferase